MLIKTYGSAVQGVDAIKITLEVNIDTGTEIKMVGLPDSAVREGTYRIESALKNAKLKIPRQKIVVNLAPADIRKAGPFYDLPIALGILAASGQMESTNIENFTIMGELGLDGEIRPIKGVLPIAIQARKDGFNGIIVPQQNAEEAAIVDKLDVYGFTHIQEVINFFNDPSTAKPTILDTRDVFYFNLNNQVNDFSEVKGQENIKRALEIAAAGGHNLILIGPPGAGKTMLAKRMPGILPPLTLQEALDTTKIHSVAGKLGDNVGLVSTRPFRSPHHTSSDVAMVGGGSNPQPGEISLAHNGVLFLDELTEFKRPVLEVLRQPLEERKITISRSAYAVDYPANFMLVTAMNPCPCGFFNHPRKECVCPPGTVQKYLNRVSGPLLDRIDLHVEVTPVETEQLSSKKEGEKSEKIRERVIRARERQIERFKDENNIVANAQMSPAKVRKVCDINKAGITLLKGAMDKLDLSARAYDRILKVSRTIADLAGSDEIKIEHLAEAIQYRSLDRESWGG